jgi:glycosyltransferase involved in cell wall biosynthesis
MSLPPELATLTGPGTEVYEAPAGARTPAATQALRPFGAVKVAVVIPCYRVERQIAAVIAGLPAWVDVIVAVNDKSPDNTAAVLSKLSDPRLIVEHHPVNQGVGGAMMTGFQIALAQGADIIVKVDGDGQMDPQYLPALVAPLVHGTADFTKGNRWSDLKSLRSMPAIRLIGNTGLGFLVRLASGYWSMFDPVNGYVAIRRDVLSMIRRPLPKRYFFESGLLIELGILRALVQDVPMPARYGDEHSSLSITRTLFGFPPRLAKGLARRLIWRYFIYDFTVVSLLLLFGLPLFVFGTIFGLWTWAGLQGEAFASAGQVMLAAMPIILGFQLLLQALVLDVSNAPRKPLCAGPLRQ